MKCNIFIVSYFCEFCQFVLHQNLGIFISSANSQFALFSRRETKHTNNVGNCINVYVVIQYIKLYKYIVTHQENGEMCVFFKRYICVTFFWLPTRIWHVQETRVRNIIERLSRRSNPRQFLEISHSTRFTTTIFRGCEMLREVITETLQRSNIAAAVALANRATTQLTRLFAISAPL